MADEKKPFGDKKPAEKKPAEAESFFAGLDAIDFLILLVIVFMVGSGAYGFYFFEQGKTFLLEAQSFFQSAAPLFVRISILFTILLITGIVYLVININKISAEENKKIYPQKVPAEVIPKAEELEATPKNGRWERVEKHMQSDNPGDWKLAILEADIMLGELLEKMNYHGESIGEMLKGVEKSDFGTLDSAWEAHKIRNSIAHEGADFLINRREADRVIALYRSVFMEFKYI